LSSCTSASQDKDTRILNPTPTTAVHLRPFVDTWNNIHLFLTFDYQISDPAAVAKRYDFVWGASVNHVAAFRSGNPNIFITYYIPFHVDWGTFSNNHARHGLAYWKTVHPNWVLYRCDRVTPAYEFNHPNVPLDFANPAVVAWQVKTYAKPASEAGYDGIAADNLGLENLFHACGVYINGKWVQRYTGQTEDPQWRADIITWLTRMQLTLHHLHHPLALIPNFTFDGLSPSDPQIQQIVNHVDGLADEDGFTLSGRGYLTGNDWRRKIQFMEAVQKSDKPYYIINQFNHSGPINRDEIQWALASYLMGKDHFAALFISIYQAYGGDTWYAEYNVQIGNPLGSMYQAQNVYFREYSNGLIIVNPSETNTYTVTLASGSSFNDLYSNSIDHFVTLAPHSGLVLLSAS